MGNTLASLHYHLQVLHYLNYYKEISYEQNIFTDYYIVYDAGLLQQ